jgi:pantothenate kinase
LKLKLVKIIFKNSVRTAKKTLHFTITKINWLTLFKEITAVYIENHTKHTNKNDDLLVAEAGGAYRYHLDLMG